MALTFSLAGLQVQLDAANAANVAGDFATARARLLDAGLVLAGLPESFDVDGAKAKLRGDLDRLATLIDGVDAASSGTDRKRLIRTQAGFPGGGRRARF